jgi:CDP-4-dehydro-6-deoxyglucose reductase
VEERVGLSRAARLAGVSRAQLQEHVEAGELETFEGKIRVADLVNLYPDAVVEDESMLHRMATIKEDARQHRGQDDPEPATREELAEELARARRERSHFRERNRALEALIQDLLGMLQEMAAQGDMVSRSHLETTINWARRRLQKGSG